MQKKLHIKIEDNVKVIAGEHKGQTGKVLTINRIKNRAIVEGINISKKHVKPQASKEKPEGGIIEKEASIHISNLMLIDPKSGEVTRVGRKKNEEERTIRYAKKSGEEIK
jgi:large subunit ribosomal protein L24